MAVVSPAELAAAQRLLTELEDALNRAACQQKAAPLTVDASRWQAEANRLTLSINQLKAAYGLP